MALSCDSSDDEMTKLGDLLREERKEARKVIMALSHHSSVDEMANLGDLLQAEQEERKALQAKLDAQVGEQMAAQVKLGSLAARWEERCRMIVIFAMIIIAYFLWSVYFYKAE